MVDNAPSVGILSCSKNPVDAGDKNIQQREKSLSLAGASEFPSQLVGMRHPKQSARNQIEQLKCVVTFNPPMRSLQL